MEIVAYIIINLLLFSSWYILLFSKKEFLPFADRLIGAFVLGLTQIIVTEMLLGIVFKKLYSTPLFLLNSFISIGILFLSVLTGRNVTHRERNNIKHHFLKVIPKELKDETTRVFRIIKGDWVLFCIFSLFFILGCWTIFLGYLFPSYTWDALWYHLPIAGYIIQSGAIKENLTPSLIDQFINIFPKNIELFFLWNIIFLKSDIIVDLSQLFFTIAGVFTIYSMAIKLKVEKKYAIYSSLLFFFTPIIILQSTTNYVDIAVSVLLLIAINFLMHDNPENYTNPPHPSPLPSGEREVERGSEAGLVHIRVRKFPILLSGMTTGILLGSKGSGLLFVVVLLTVIAIQELIRHFNPFKLLYNFPSNTTPSKYRGSLVKDSFKPYLFYFILPSFLIGGYWYIKNWVLYNNPVYPMEISFFNITLFKGLYKGIIDPAPEVISNLSPLTRLLYVWLERVRYYLYDSRLSGFGPLWFILFLPSLVFSFGYAIKRKKYNFLFVGMILIVTFILHPRNWNTRYVIFIVGLGALSFGIVIDYFNKRESLLKIIALLLVGFTFLTANSPCVLPEKIKEFIFLPREERTIIRHAPFNIDLQARQEYGYWIWISNNVAKGDTLAYTFEPLFLSPLWNREFSNKIVYIEPDTYNEWLKKLKESNVTYVLIRLNSIEDKWINKERELLANYRWLGTFKERFKVVYNDANYKILRFRGDEGKTQ